MSILDLFKRKPKYEPIVINDDLGTFTSSKFGKDMIIFQGIINWIDTQAYVDLFPDDNGSIIADKALENLRKIITDAAKWDQRLKEYAADDMSEADGMIEIWGNGEDLENQESRLLFLLWLH